MPWKIEPKKTCPTCGASVSYRSAACRLHGRTWPARKPRPCIDCGRPRTLGYRRCRACAYRARKEKTRPARPCPVCRIEFFPPLEMLHKGYGKYCSKACYVTRQHEQELAVDVTCAQCGTQFRRKLVFLRRSKRVFCGQRCSRRFNKGSHVSTWRGGGNSNRGSRWFVRAALIRDRDAHQCVRCGISETENGERLSVDHRVPWRYLPKRLANHPSNIVSLCRRCHAWKTAAEGRWLNGDVQDIKRYLTLTETVPCVHSLPGRFKVLTVNLEAIALSNALKRSDKFAPDPVAR